MIYRFQLIVMQTSAPPSANATPTKRLLRFMRASYEFGPAIR